MLRDDDALICPQPVGKEWEKFEFWVLHDGVREAHQAKRQAGFTGSWTLASLGSAGVLPAFRGHLERSTTDEVRFVSTIGVNHLSELIERARRAPDEAGAGRTPAVPDCRFGWPGWRGAGREVRRIRIG